jgi:hypothetical protein
LVWWSNEARQRDRNLTFVLYFYPPDKASMKQGYEPIYHASHEDSLWINEIMSNLGFNYGNKFDRIKSFNTWLQNHAVTQWAYSVFIAYNPPDEGAPTRFSDRYFAYAYLGGPYTQICYKNGAWSIYDTGKILSHETGHIFWACDEYYAPGYGGCTSCDPCNSFRPIMNGNCVHPSCNPDHSVPCIMRYTENALCSYTALQVGWHTYKLKIEAGEGGTTDPEPGIHEYDIYSSVPVQAIPYDYHIFKNWEGALSGNKNPDTILMYEDRWVKAIFRLIHPPANISGQKVLNRSLSQAEYINILKWESNPHNQDLFVIKYRIYEVCNGNMSLLTELNADQFEYWHRGVQKDITYTYAIAAVISSGKEGQPMTIVIY